MTVSLMVSCVAVPVVGGAAPAAEEGRAVVDARDLLLPDPRRGRLLGHTAGRLPHPIYCQCHYMLAADILRDVTGGVH